MLGFCVHCNKCNLPDNSLTGWLMPFDVSLLEPMTGICLLYNHQQCISKGTDTLVLHIISSSTSGFIILIVVIIIIPLQPRAFWLSVSAACSIFTEHLTADYPPVCIK